MLNFSDINPSPSNNSVAENDVEFKISGNLMSLINATDFDNMEIPSSSVATFLSLFYNSNLTDASELILPSQTLTVVCYGRMFQECIKLVNAPTLPATTLAESCYTDMFAGCVSLVSAPVLPATTFNEQCEGCYENMFNFCEKLAN